MAVRVHPFIQAMSAYKPPLEGRTSSSATPYLLLDFNERTVPLPSAVIEALARYVNANCLHRYPEYGTIATEISQYAGVSADSLMITNGSDQAIDIIFRAFTDSTSEAIIPAPTFAIHDHSAHLQGCKVIAPLYTREQGYPLAEVLGSITEATRLIVVCNPNNPTGTLVPAQDIARIAAAAPNAVVLVDECYFEFSKVTAKDYLQELPNIVITRTFSKTWGLASLRIGYVIAAPDIIDELLKIRGPYDVNRASIEVVRAALQHRSYVAEYALEVMEQSLPLFLQFLEKNRLRYWPPGGNFVLVEFSAAAAVEEGLRERGILVRPRKGPNIDGTLRISLGTREQTERLIAAIGEILRKQQ